jgi:uncharacterized protein (DUF983 family)
MPVRSHLSLFQALSRGLCLRCPRCGEGRLFVSWNHLAETCPVCGLEFERRLGDTWFFMYMSTAGLSGVLVVAMFLIRPRVVWVGQAIVCVAAVAVIGFSLPYRKGIAVALDYWIEGDGSGDGVAPGV